MHNQANGMQATSQFGGGTGAAPASKGDPSASMMDTDTGMTNPNMAVAMPGAATDASAGMASTNAAVAMPAAGGAESLAGAAALSDERDKDQIHDADKRIAEFLDHIKAKSYHYKAPYQNAALGGEGEFVSPMAQDLEQSELGKTMVEKDNKGNRVVDYGKGLGVMTAGLAYLNEQLKKKKDK